MAGKQLRAQTRGRWPARRVGRREFNALVRRVDAVERRTADLFVAVVSLIRHSPDSSEGPLKNLHPDVDLEIRDSSNPAAAGSSRPGDPR
jgi:hypothetical protein